MINFKNIFWLGAIFSFTWLSSCTDLEYELTNELSEEDAEIFFAENGIGELVESAYFQTKESFQGLQSVWHLEEFSGDHILMPTRGPHWNDGGRWLDLFNHTWDPDHSDVNDAFEKLLKVVFKTTEVLNTNPEDPEVVAEMKFLRAVAVGTTTNLWGQVPIRVNFDDLLSAPPVMNAEEATQFVLDELRAIIPDLPTTGPATKANVDAGKTFLMHMLLNKGAFVKPDNPTFDAADMEEIIKLADEVIATGKYNMDCHFFDNFLAENDFTSCENIYTFENLRGDPSAENFRKIWLTSLHDNQIPVGGWNGFAALSDFYDSFEPEDERIYYEEPTNFGAYGFNLGFLTGVQTYPNGDTILDVANGNLPVIYTPDVDQIMVDPIEKFRFGGYRLLKYNVDVQDPNLTSNNFVLLRYAHVLFMKAEALFRNGNVAAATDVINEIRNARGLPDLTSSLDEEQLLEEYGHEFWLEARRRTDLIRFGKFLAASQLKDETTDAKYYKFSIPQSQVTRNENLEQNPGY